MGKEEDRIMEEAREHMMREEAIGSAGLAQDADRTAGGVAPELEEAGDMSTSDGLAVERALDPLTKDDVDRVRKIATAIENLGIGGRDAHYLRKLSQRIAATIGAVLVALVLLAGCGSDSASTTSPVPVEGEPSKVQEAVDKLVKAQPEDCDQIETVIFLRSYGAAEDTFMKEWVALGYQQKLDGRRVFLQLVEACKAKEEQTR